MSCTVALKKRQDTHLARKLWHLFGVFFMFVCYQNLSRQEALMILVVATISAISFDLFRLQNKNINNTVIKWLRPIMRDNEAHQISGLSYMLIGVFFIVLFFEKNIVNLSLLFLGLADPIASYVGIRYGRDKIFKGKTLQGTLAAFVVCLGVSIFYFHENQLMLDRLAIVSLLAAFSGALAEALPVADLDDNLVMPILSAVFLHVIFYYFGGFIILET